MDWGLLGGGPRPLAVVGSSMA